MTQRSECRVLSALVTMHGTVAGVRLAGAWGATGLDRTGAAGRSIFSDPAAAVCCHRPPATPRECSHRLHLCSCAPTCSMCSFMGRCEPETRLSMALWLASCCSAKLRSISATGCGAGAHAPSDEAPMPPQAGWERWKRWEGETDRT